jgi:hypothetical protein
MATLPTAFDDIHKSPNRGRSHRTRRRGSSIPIIRDSPSPTPSSFSTLDSFNCPICGITLCTTSSAVFDDHVDHCNIRRTMISPFERWRSISPSSSSDADPSETPSKLDAFSGTYIPRHPYNDARYTISGTGDAVEFGGFGAVEPLDADSVGVDYEQYVPRPVSLRRKQLLGRAGLRRRLAVDLAPLGTTSTTS